MAFRCRPQERRGCCGMERDEWEAFFAPREPLTWRLMEGHKVLGP